MYLTLICLTVLTIVTTTFAKSWKDEHLVASDALPYAPGQVPLNDTYSGLSIVRKDDYYQGALWYWFFPAEEPLVDNPPTLLWVQGGPGSSSSVALFYELGPLMINEKQELIRNEYTWSKHYNLLFVDNPVGTGYSYIDPPSNVTLTAMEIKYLGDGPLDNHLKTRQNQAQIPFYPPPPENNEDYAEGYAHTREGYSRDMVHFLLDFYKNFPEMSRSPLYLTSESYGGKYIPAMATAILDYNESGQDDIKLPLTGIAIGNQWTDPNTQILTHAPQAYYLGLLSPSQRSHLSNMSHTAVALNLAGHYSDALDLRMRMFEAFTAFTGGVNFYDVRRGNRPYSRSRMRRFMNDDAVKRALHVPARFDWGTDHAVVYYLRKDIMMSTAPLFPRLLRKLRVMLYQGQFDFRDGAASQDAWIEGLEWEGVSGYLETERVPWVASSVTGAVSWRADVYGYVQESSNLTRVVVSGAGHMMPGDQPQAALDMITRWIEGAGWD